MRRLVATSSLATAEWGELGFEEFLKPRRSLFPLREALIGVE